MRNRNDFWVSMILLGFVFVTILINSLLLFAMGLIEITEDNTDKLLIASAMPMIVAYWILRFVLAWRPQWILAAVKLSQK